MIDSKGLQNQVINQHYCPCAICTEPQHVVFQPQSLPCAIARHNSMAKFLDLLPPCLGLMLTPTAVLSTKQYYFNKFGDRVYTLPFNKITEHFPLALHLVLHYSKSSTMAYKYELLKANPNYLYVQAYSAQVPLEVVYKREDDGFIDSFLGSKVPEIVRQMQKDEHNNMSEENRKFLRWVHEEYKDELFCKCMTKILLVFLESFAQGKIVSASLEWLVEKQGVARLNNVKDLLIEPKVCNKSFQDEYEERIMEKLQKDSCIQLKLLTPYSGQSRERARVKQFKKQIQDFYEGEKLKIIQKTEKERNISSKTLSDKIAGLFLPDLHKYSNLREVLNDEKKFRKVVLGAREDKKPKHLPTVHKRCKTEV